MVLYLEMQIGNSLIDNKQVDLYNKQDWPTLRTPSNSEIICVQNVGAKVEMVSYLKK